MADTAVFHHRNLQYNNKYFKGKNRAKQLKGESERISGFYAQVYADDLAVLVTGADMLWIRAMAQKAINIAANWGLEQELQFSSKKTERCRSLTNGIQIWVFCQRMVQNLNFPRKQGC